MTIRAQNLETVGAIYLTFDIKQTTGADDLVDDDIGKAVELSADNEVTLASDGGVVLGKLIALTLSDRDSGERKATVQVAGVMTLPTVATYPQLANRVVGGGSGTVKQAPVLGGYDPAGGNIARGTVLAVNGTTNCTLLLN